MKQKIKDLHKGVLQKLCTELEMQNVDGYKTSYWSFHHRPNLSGKIFNLILIKSHNFQPFANLILHVIDLQ